MSQNPLSPLEPVPLESITTWDIDTDVAVIGFGGGGACAAIAAHDSGADVCILELASGAGGSTALSSAELYLGGSGGTRVQRACGWEDKTEDMVAYLAASAGDQADMPKIRRFAENSSDHFDWLESLGVPFKDSEYPYRAMLALTDDCLLYTGSEKAWPFSQLAKPCPRGHNLMIEGDNGGPLLMQVLADNTKTRGIETHFDTRALTLVFDRTESRVCGVLVRQNMQIKAVKASRGVILCCGGFVMNESMLEKYAPSLKRCTTPIGNPGDTGVGIQMGLGVGAAAINMHEGFVSLPFYPPASLTFGVLVNAQGQRFINEDAYHGRVGAFVLKQSGDRVFLVCGVEDYADYETNAYLNADVAATGDTIEELEKELGLPTGQLQHTLNYYNEQAFQQIDPLFHKSSEWLKPIQGPYVALDCTPGRGAYFPYFTLGGLDTTVDGEVKKPDGKIIAGLYAAGRTAAGVPRRGEGYASGMSVADATFSGRIAGAHAAAHH